MINQVLITIAALQFTTLKCIYADMVQAA